MENTYKNLIYGLIDPRDGQLRYIGLSSSGMSRPKDHGKESRLKRNKTRTGNWIKSLQSQGLTYEIEVLEEYPNDISHKDLEEAEIWNIAYYKSLGCELYNHT